MKRPVSGFFAALLSITAIISCNDQDSEPALVTKPLDYPVFTLTPRSITLSSDYPVNIEGQQNIEIRPKIDGYIDAIYVDEGATVKKGQRLFKIFAPQFSQEVRTAEANIEIAEADVNSAQMEVNKVRPLVEKDIISDYELESAKFNLQSKQAALAQARARLENAKTNLSYTVVSSPANGVVGSIPYRIGSLVSSTTTQPLTTVSNIGNIYAYFSINEKQALEFSRNTKGNTMEERLSSMPPVRLILSNGSLFPQEGRIETASGIISSETGSVRVRATFPNPGNIIRSGSSGKVQIPSFHDSALIVPQKSTFEIQGKKFVYTLTDSSRVKSTEIKIIESSNGQFYVVVEGLAAGDRIILEGVGSLFDGAEILPAPVNTDSLYRSLDAANK